MDPNDIPAEDLILTYRIEEGRQYRVGNLTVDGNTFFSTDDLQNELQGPKSKFKEVFDQVELKMLKNWTECIRAMDLQAQQVVQLAKNSFEGSFLSDAEKKKWLGEVEKFSSKMGSI